MVQVAHDVTRELGLKGIKPSDAWIKQIVWKYNAIPAELSVTEDKKEQVLQQTLHNAHKSGTLGSKSVKDLHNKDYTSSTFKI